MSKILIVEDNQGAREMLSAILRGNGFKVVEAEDGQSGLAKAKNERPDLIITDICMPKLGGIDMIKHLRSHSDFTNVPILALTAYTGELLTEAIRAGADRALQKPIDFDYFFSTIERLV